MALQVGTERRLLRIASRARQHEVVLEEGMYALLEAEERLSRTVSMGRQRLPKQREG